MFGVRMLIMHKGQKVTLRAFTKDDMPVLVRYFDSMKIHMYTKGLFAQTLENEIEWYDKNRKDSDSCVWAIQPEGDSEPIGITSLHKLNSRDNSSTSGIIIWNPEYWNKGIASAAHLGRTLFAADYLNRMTIRSSARTVNAASRKALERVGYTVWGTEPRTVRRGGQWLDTDHLLWIRPDVTEILYPEGLPEGLKAGVERARIALETAREVVTML